MRSGHLHFPAVVLLLAAVSFTAAAVAAPVGGAHLLDTPGEYLLGAGGVFRDPLSSTGSVLEGDQGLLFQSAVADASLALDFSDKTSPIPEHGISWKAASHPRGNLLSLKGLRGGASVHLRHLGRSSGLVVVDGREVAFEGASGLAIHGRPSSVTVDLTEHGLLSSTIVLGTIVSETTGREVLVISSEAGEFQPTEIQCDGIDDLMLIAGTGAEPVYVGDIPFSFVGDLHVNSNFGDHAVLIESEREPNYRGNFTGRITAVGRSPCGTQSGTSIMFSGTCVCGGTDFLQFVGIGPSAVVDIQAPADLQTDAGAMTFDVADGTLNIDGSIMTNTGLLDVDVACTDQDCIAFTWGGMATLGGDVDVVAEGLAGGVRITGTIVGSVPSAGSFVVGGSITDSSTLLNVVGTHVMAPGMIDLQNYDEVVLDGTVECTTPTSNSVRGFVLDTGASMSFGSAVAANTLTHLIDVRSSVDCSTATCFGTQIDGPVTLTNVHAIIEGTVQNPTGSGAVGIHFTGPSSPINGINSNLEVFGDTLGTTGFRQAVSVQSKAFIFTPGAGGNDAVVLDARIGDTTGLGAFFELSSFTWNVPDLTFTTENSPSFGGRVNGIDTDTIDISGSSLTVRTRVGTSSSGDAKAGWVDDTSVVTYNTIDILSTAPSGAIGDTASGIDWMGTTLTANALTIDASLNNDVGRSGNNVGIRFDAVTIDITSPVPVSTISGYSGCGMPGSVNNHGVVLSGLTSFTSEGTLEIFGRNAPNSLLSHGVLIPSASVVFWNTASITPGSIEFDGNALPNAATGANHGILIESTGTLVGNNGDISLLGECGGQDCSGVQLLGSVEHGNGDVIIQGDNGYLAGVFISGSFSISVAPVSVSITGTGTTSPVGGKGVILSNSFTFFSNGDLASLTVMGTGGSGDGGDGVSIQGDFAVLSLQINGEGGDSGVSNVGIDLSSLINVFGPAVIDGTSGCAVSGTNCVGVDVGGTLSSSSTSGISITGRVSGGSSPTGVAVAGQVNSMGTVSLLSSGNVAMDNVVGVLLEGGQIVVPDGFSLVVDSTIDSPMGGIAVLLDGGNIDATDIDISGVNVLGNDGKGVRLQSALTFASFADKVMSIYGVGQTGVDWAATMNLARFTLTVEGDCGGSDSPGIVGISMTGSVSMVGNPSSMVFTGLAGDESSLLNGNIGMVVAGDITGSAGSMITIFADGSGAADCKGLSWQSGDIAGPSVNIVATAMSDMPGQDNIAFFVDGALMETISFADITVSAIVSSASSRTDDIGVVWNGRLTLSGSDIHITGVGGSGGAGGNIGILFSGGELICGSGYNPSSFTLEGSGSGTEGDNAGVVFGASFLGVDGSNAGLGSCDLLVVGTGSDDGTTSDNDGIRFEGDFTSDSVNSVFEGIGKGDASHGIYMGPSVITFGITTDSITLNGTAENSNSFGVLCNNCDLVSVNGDITFLGESPLDSNSIAFTSGFDHPTKDAGEFTFEDFTHVVGGFSLDGETDLHFNGGVRFADGTVVIDVDDVDLLVSTYLTGSDLSMTVRGFPIVVSGTLSNDADTDVTFQRNILALGDVTFLTHGEMTFERDIRGDFFEILTDLTITGSGDAYVNSDATGFDNILIDVDGFTFESGGLVFDAFTELEFDTTINFSSGASNGPVLLIANETVTIGDDIMGTAPVTLRIAAETIIFSDGLYSLSSGMIILQESLFLIIDEQRGYEAPRWSAMVPTFGDFVAELAGTFSTQVIVRGSMSALASGSFTSLDMEENSFLKPGSMLTGTGCFTCADLTMAHGSTLVANIDGGVGLSGGCNNLYDRIDVSNSFVISGGSVALDVTATANTVRGNEYAIVADPVTSSGTFSGFPEGSVIGSTPALVLSYVGGSGTSFTLRANELPVPQDDMYTFVAPFSLPAPGILANDTDPDMGTLSVASFSPLSPDDESCTVNRDLDGSLTATGSCIGTYTFSYDVTDGQETAGPATVTLNGILPSPSPTQTPTETTTPTSTSSLSSTTSLSPTATPPPSNSASPTTTATSTPSSTSSTTTTASATQTGTATATSTRTATKSATSTSSATNSPTSTGSSTSSVSPTASMTPSTTMTITATTTPSETSSQTPSTTASPTSTGSSTVTPSRTDSQTTTQSLGASASKTPTKSQSKTPTLSSSKSPTRTPSATRTTSKTGSGSKTSTPSPSSTRSQSSSPSATKSSQPTPSPTRTPSKTPSNTVTPTASLSQGSTPSATATTSSSESASATTSPTASSSATASASLSATQTGSASPTSTETPSSTTSATGSASASLSPTATASEAMASPTNTRAAASATASPTPIVPSAIPSHSRAAASASSGAEAPQAPSASRSRSRSQAGGAIVLPSTVPNPSASICIGAFCVPPNAAPAPNDIPLEVEILPEGTETIKEVRNQEGKEVGRVTVPGDSGGAVLVVNQASSDVRLVEEVVTDVVDVTIVDGSGNVLDTFDGDDLEVCFSTEDFDTDDVCLGFYNDDGTWECQDYCLSTTSGTDGEDLLCGNTPHLTNFALLLSDEAGSESRCGSSSIDYLFVYLSVAAVCLAMIIVFIAVAARESYLRYDIYQTDKRLTYNGSSGRGLGSGGSGSEGLASFSTD